MPPWRRKGWCCARRPVRPGERRSCRRTPRCRTRLVRNSASFFPRNVLAGALDGLYVPDVLDVAGFCAGGPREPGVENLFELGLRGGAEAQREHVGVVPAA